MIARALKAGLVFTTSLALIAAQEPPERKPDYPEPPAIVAERIVDGRFEPGHFEYLRGYFPEASEAEKAQYAELVEWLEQCRTEGRERLDAELAKLDLRLQEDRYTSAQASLCRQVFRGDQMRGRFKSYDELAEASSEARLVFATLVESVRLAELTISAAEPDFARQLEVRTMSDQLLRHSFSWSGAKTEAPRLPQLSEGAGIVFATLTLGEAARVDRENTRWLKQQVAQRGWPRKSEVGEKASNAAWLLAQHADHDPAFQYKALQMMEPLVAQDEVDKGNFAYLYDRIMLKLNGKQRFGSQITCVRGEHAPHALEDSERLDELRKEMGLGPIAEYLSWFTGECR